MRTDTYQIKYGPLKIVVLTSPSDSNTKTGDGIPGYKASADVHKHPLLKREFEELPESPPSENKQFEHQNYVPQTAHEIPSSELIHRKGYKQGDEFNSEPVREEGGQRIEDSILGLSVEEEKYHGNHDPQEMVGLSDVAEFMFI